jgi:hypothetical protein
MTPKEKAAELIVNYQLKCTSLNYDEAKQCALIAVDEVLKVAFYTNDEIYEHYIQVKQEIEKL